jgi:hypothetical protein
MLNGIASALAAGDGRGVSLRRLSAQLRAAGFAAINAAHYEGGHWLGSFAVYLATDRGILR